jgi:phenylalanyl-tRNA synthetase alpha chain
VVTKYENFYSVNIPATHPATEMHDTFFLHQHDQTGDNLILRTQTSAMQNTILKNHPLPIKAIIP